MNIKVEIKKILKGDKPTKAYANIVIDDAVVIHGVGVVENEKGRYMSMDEKEFELIKKTVHNIHNARQAYRHGCEVESLDVVGLKLTNRCNLRCKHCYEWNNEGYHHSMDISMQSEDMPYEVIEKFIEETKESKPTFYLWGGEPLIYGHIQKLLNRLADENYVVAICTNGHYVLKYLEELKRFGSNLEVVIALEGMEKENDIIRGTGSFNKVAEVIATLSKLKKEGLFKGKITVHTMISNENVFTIKEYIQLMKDWGVENLILCLPWYLSSKISRDMDKFYNEKFDWLSFNNMQLPEVMIPATHIPLKSKYLN